MTEAEGAPELQGPPEVLEAIDRFLADPSTGTRGSRPQRKLRGHGDGFPKYQVGHQTFFPAEEQAELEYPISDGESYKTPHWLLITGLGLVIVGVLVRWWLRGR